MILEDIIGIEILKDLLLFLLSVKNAYSRIDITYPSYKVNGDRTIFILSKLCLCSWASLPQLEIQHNKKKEEEHANSNQRRLTV
jgi:hypothetical protein